MMALIIPKEMILESFMNVAKKGLMDKDYLISKMQFMVSDGDLEQEDIRLIIDELCPEEPT